MRCPKCNSNNKTKAGFVGRKQRFKCKECGCFFSVKFKSTALSHLYKRKALHLYIEGFSFREIGRILEVSNVSIMKWIKSYGEEIKKLNKEAKTLYEININQIDFNFISSHGHPSRSFTSIPSDVLIIGMDRKYINSCRYRKEDIKKNNKE
ncbi:MAG TPA: hypothetical protein DD434_09750 [Bacteroidales bacterium]|mgnify:CR=1 FL=1|nr:hypothetical protein [Bacteroidales bacterium]